MEAEPSRGGCSSGVELEADAAIVSPASLHLLLKREVVDINLTDFIVSGCNLRGVNPNVSSDSDAPWMP